MGTKIYKVREGFIYRTRDAKGNEKTYTEGDTVELDTDLGDGAHQLEYANEEDRAAALKAEQKAAKANKSAQVEAQGGIDHEALAATVAAAVAQAMTSVITSAQSGATATQGQGG
ncbi:MAG TPA: hypothetical protein VL968_05680 [Rhodocyclaceae bacterium]|jgi:hypothetical protein|nr:hypothetical protein [Rhodocyclaceae bacterium]